MCFAWWCVFYKRRIGGGMHDYQVNSIGGQSAGKKWRKASFGSMKWAGFGGKMSHRTCRLPVDIKESGGRTEDTRCMIAQRHDSRQTVSVVFIM